MQYISNFLYGNLIQYDIYRIFYIEFISDTQYNIESKRREREEKNNKEREIMFSN
jgi:hypothetical protein